MRRAEIVLIAAMDRRRGIGRGNALPWHLPEDLRRFKALTVGQTVLMGRKTAQSLGRALPKRENLVLSRHGRVPFEGMHAVASLQEAVERCAGQPLFVIGGGEIYAIALPLATRMHLTLVDTEVEDADAFFPDYAAEAWEVTGREAHAADARHAFGFEFVEMQRVV